MLLQDLVYAPFIGVEELLGPGMRYTQLVADRFNGLVEYFLDTGHTQTLVGEIFRVVIVIKLASPTLVIEVIKTVVILVTTGVRLI